MKLFSKLLALYLFVILFAACNSENENENEGTPFIGNVVLKSQAEVDAFASNQYSGVDGMLRLTSPGVGAASNITDISRLSSLKYVAGDLDIFNNSLTTLNGLQNITRIGGSLYVNSNEKLTEVNALSNLTDLGENLVISDSKNLISIDGFSGLTIIKGNLSIGVDVGGGALGLPNLSDLNGLSNLESVNGDIQISGTKIRNLQGLESITIAIKDLTISYNNSLENLSGLENLASIGGSLFLSNNANIREVNALSNLLQIGDILEVASNSRLTDVSGFSNLISAENALTMYSNSTLATLGNAFQNLEIASRISISDGELESIQGFNSLSQCDYIDIQNNLHLESISGFETLSSCKFLLIGNNENLRSIAGFQNLISVEEFSLIQPTTIVDPPISIIAFSNLSTVVTTISISGLANTDIDFISNLQTVGNQLNITYNENLTDLCGLNRLVFNEGLEGEFNVFHNLYNPTQQNILEGNCNQ